MTGSRQWARSGQARDNALLQGYLAAGYSYDEAGQLAAEQAAPATADEAMGRILIWIFKASVAFIILIMVFSFIQRNDADNYHKCVDRVVVRVDPPPDETGYVGPKVWANEDEVRDECGSGDGY